MLLPQVSRNDDGSNEARSTQTNQCASLMKKDEKLCWSAFETIRRDARPVVIAHPLGWEMVRQRDWFRNFVHRSEGIRGFATKNVLCVLRPVARPTGFF